MSTRPPPHAAHAAQVAQAALADVVDGLVADLPTASPPTVSVWLGGPAAGAVYRRRDLDRHYAASTVKLPLLVAAYRMHERGTLDLDAQVSVHNRFRSALDGSPFSLDQSDDQDDDTWSRLGSTTTLRTLARHATVRSGNLAANLLLEQVGAAEVAAVLRDAGCSATTTLPRGIGDGAAREAGLDNQVTSRDLARVLGAVAVRRLGSPATCAAVEALLAAQEHNEQVPAGLPEGTYVAHKTGWVPGVAHDVALVRPAGRPPYVLALCVTAEADEQDLFALNAAVSAAAWDAWDNWDHSEWRTR